MPRLLIISFLISLCYLPSFAQIEKVNIERYYITDANDATDTLGGHLEAGAVTYRIFVDLLPGSKIISIYGDANHPLVFSGDQPFFNHREEGISFGKDLNKNRYGIGTVALDSYITLGQCSRSFSQAAYFGVPKEKDHDGSIVGGVNNDGGSLEIPGGLLTNDDSQIGLPLPTADGLAVNNQLPDSWIEIGFIDLLSNEDTTIFGSATPKSNCYLTNAILKNSGVTGVSAEENEVLVAQLTTKGEIKFEINLEVEIKEGDIVRTVKYVARNEALGQNEIFEPLLNFPYECGCTDPDYLEASTTFACTDNNKCKTRIVYGCMDSLACNYDPAANLNIQDICCYVGYCHDLDISVVCPDLRPRTEIDLSKIRLFPNPVYDELQVDLDFVHNNDIDYAIYDMLGKVVRKGIMPGQDKRIPVDNLAQGYFTLRMSIDQKFFALPFVKI